MSELLGSTGDRKGALKALIRGLHVGGDPEQAKQQFAALLATLTATEVAQVEEELIAEGMPRQEVERLCDLHLALFQEALEKEGVSAQAEHPIRILMAEHELLLKLGSELKTRVEALRAVPAPDAGEAVEQLRRVVRQFKEAQSHYLREENVLFPYLEKHGVVQPPAIMWSEHDRIRAIERGLYESVEAGNGAAPRDLGERLQESSASLAEMLASHFYKENNILFPTALEVLTEPEWDEVARGFGEIGYWRIAPEVAAAPTGRAEAAPEPDGAVVFETGAIPRGVIEVILNTLPVDITFVDGQDTVRYFSQTKDRIFPRTTAIIGRKVQQCHPKKSVHVVNQILDDFRAGHRDTADFWIQSGGRFISIRYFALRGKGGEYLGCLEVTQDATEVRMLEGEKRLL